MTKVIFATFSSEGPPHDEGFALAQECLPPFLAAVKASGVDEAYGFTPRTLIPILGEEVAKRCTRPLPITPKPFLIANYHKVGHGAWKAEIIKYLVDTHADGDIIIFHDSNWKKYPGILANFAPQCRNYATAAMAVANRNKIFVPPCGTIIQTLTRSTFNRCGPGVDHEALLACPYGRARLIVLQINPTTREFAHTFAKMCENEENLLGGPEAWTECGGWSRPGFVHNAAEQAVFNALVYGTGLWDVKKDDWILPLGMIGVNDQDTGTGELLSWAAANRNWKPDR